VDTTPGTISRYSGGGTTIMQQLLVDVTGKPFPALMQELVLGPAGMTHSTYEQPLPAARATEASRAHDRRGGVVPGGWHVYPEMAPAGLWTTPTDLARWALAITEARAGRSTNLLSAATVAQMLTPVKDGIGLGPFVGDSGRAFHFGHGGANEGFHSELVMFPELGVGAAVMTNGDGGPLVIRETLRALAAEYDWPSYGQTRVTLVTLDSAAVSGLAGQYRLQVGPGIPAEVRNENGKLTLHAPQLPENEELLPESDSTFVMSTLGWRITFARDASGRGTGLTVRRDVGPPIAATRVR
jgi:CubicO group peptidase (beta-lactamase class C family)